MLPSHNSCLTVNVSGPAVKLVFCTAASMSGHSLLKASRQFSFCQSYLETRWCVVNHVCSREDAMPERNSDLFEIMATTRSMRRLKPDPVPPELIRKILDAGVCAPSGGNMQRWRFLVVKDPNVKQTVGAYYKRAWDDIVNPRYRAGE